MPIKPRYMQTTPAQRTVSIDASTLGYLDQIAPDNISEALRYCVQFAMQHPDALFRATVQHTAAQCRKHQQRYPADAAPLPTTYGGHVMTARPAPEPALKPEPIQSAAVWTQPEPRLVSEPVNERAAQVTEPAAVWTQPEPRLVSEPVNERAAQVTEPAAVWTQPEPIQPQRAHLSEARPGTLEEYLMYADDDDEPAQVALQRVEPLEPIVIRGQPLSAAALAAVAAVALTDEEIRALDPARGGARPFVG
mgnify:CR=1 FL=1